MYWRLALSSIKAQMQYKLSFGLSAAGQLAGTAIEILGIWALFTRFGSLPHWSLSEVCLFYGVVNVGFAVADGMATGFDHFGVDYVRTGNFDRLLVRPRGLILQLLAHELAIRRLGRLVQGLIVMVWALTDLGIDLEWPMIVFLIYTIIGGTCLFLGLFVFQAALSFWTVESLEVMNTLTYGGVESSQYPLSIYDDWFRKFFTYVVPLACVAYFPILLLLDKTDPLGSSRLFQLLAPVAGYLFLAAAILAFSRGVRHYTSTGN